MAAGLWVVHTQYLLQSARVGHFLPEEGFEWGNPAAENILQPLLEDNERARQLGAACHRWRRQAHSCGGAFSKFVATFVGAPQKMAPFERMIVAGGGKVVPFG
jgi:hypothetical protein